MELEKVVFSDLQPNFLNLSLLICSLFAGGNFKMAHILYDQEEFDDRLLIAIESTCPLRILKMTIEISAPRALESDEIGRTDHILQLIFLPRQDRAKVMKRIEEVLTFYRVFIFSSTDEVNSEQKWMKDLKFVTNRNSSTLLLNLNSSSGVVKLYNPSKNLSTAMEVDLQPNRLQSDVDIFDNALGEKALVRDFAITYIDHVDCDSINPGPMNALFKILKIFGNFYFHRFNMSYVDAISVRCDRLGNSANHTIIRPIPRKVYSELSFKSEIITMGSK